MRMGPPLAVARARCRVRSSTAAGQSHPQEQPLGHMQRHLVVAGWGVVVMRLAFRGRSGGVGLAYEPEVAGVFVPVPVGDGFAEVVPVLGLLFRGPRFGGGFRCRVGSYGDRFEEEALQRGHRVGPVVVVKPSMRASAIAWS